jgi:signal transduction histidine kinase
VTLRSEGPDCEIAVTDTGTGIASDMLPFVFDRFWRADTSPEQRFSGLGLGLALAKRLVELHGGTVTATSAGPNQGSTFTVILPRVAPRVSSPDQHSTSLHNADMQQYDAHVNVKELQGD